MNKKKILIVSGSFYPENSPRSFRTTELVKEFSRQGHDITLYIPKNDKEHIIFENEFNVNIKDLGKSKCSRFNINTGNTIYRLLKRFLNRILSLLFEYPNIEFMFQTRNVLKDEDNYDLLITIAVPHPIHWGAAWARKKNHRIAKLWIADSGDPFMGITLDSFKKLFYFKYIEKWWNRKVDYISVPFEGAIEGYYEEFREKIKIIPQGFKFDEIDTNSDNFVTNEVPTFAYAGGIIPARNPKLLLQYLLNLNIEFKFIFYTKQKNYLEPFIEQANGMIEIRDYVPRIELLNELKKMDFIVNFENGNSTQLPSKLIDYSLTKRPILSIVANNFEKEIVNEFIEGDYSKQFIVENISQYCIDKVCKQFLDLR